MYGGLTCVYARRLTREGLWEGLKARRCYATSGQRILLEVWADGHPMGSEYSTGAPPEITLKVAGTAPIERVDLFRGLEMIHSYPEKIERRRDRVRVSWSGQRIRGRNRLVNWDGSLEVEQGQIVSALGYAFDSASEGICAVEERSVSWKSVTTGDADGVVLTLEAGAGTVLRFKSAILRHSLALGELEAGPVELDAGGIDMKVVFEYLPLDLGRGSGVFICRGQALSGLPSLLGAGFAGGRCQGLVQPRIRDCDPPAPDGGRLSTRPDLLSAARPSFLPDPAAAAPRPEAAPFLPPEIRHSTQWRKRGFAACGNSA